VNQLTGERDLSTAKAVPPKQRAERAFSGGGPHDVIFRAECTRL